MLVGPDGQEVPLEELNGGEALPMARTCTYLNSPAAIPLRTP